MSNKQPLVNNIYTINHMTSSLKIINFYIYKIVKLMCQSPTNITIKSFTKMQENHLFNEKPQNETILDISNNPNNNKPNYIN